MDLLLLILIFGALAMFISTLLNNQKKSIQSSKNVEEKLDKLIEVMENKRHKK